jgi:hypothetical protein
VPAAIGGAVPRYRVGDIGVVVAGTSPRWERRISGLLRRQLGGLESHEQDDLRGLLILDDYASPTLARCRRAGLPVHESGGVALLEHESSLYVWCADVAALSLPFVLNPLMVTRGRTLCHAAALSDQGDGIMIAGRSGAGKTSALLALMAQRRFKIMSDDYVICDRRGVMLAYPTPLTIYPHHRRLLRDAGAAVRTTIVPGSLFWRGTRLVFTSLGMEEAFARRFAPGYAVVRAADLYPEARINRGDASIRSVYVIAASTDRVRVTPRRATSEETSALLVEATRQDWSAMMPVLQGVLAGRRVTTEQYFHQLTLIVQEALHHAERCVVVETPSRMPAAEIAHTVARLVTSP